MSKLAEMKLMARGNPRKIAEYNLKEREYYDFIKQYFDDEHKFVDSPNEFYIKEVEEKAKSGDEMDVMRYKILKDRFDYYQSFKGSKRIDNAREIRSKLQAKLQNGDKITKDDLTAAEKLARTYPGPDSLVLYSRIKREIDSADAE
ncbi:hypothetical protein [Calidifontibacillus erzurumensis]|uniref:Uncharacterized protein n=1 Tax=Calidifontibacillus erzurumensis TaxID=2741433 RepID=A0A8J8GDV1_9BACI|nr:hypothetical protein [Calidifontibacillus erzurumensis]NSL51704.1 hypothetical protein [Calidifontibacillus erzurumensis]